MQSAEAVLDVLRDRGRRGLPLEGLYRQLFNPQLFLLAYGRIYSNKGAMTPGPDAETADGMTLGKIERIIDALRHERYRFKPVRRHYIPKKDGRKRPLGLPSWSDKLLGEVIRLLLEAYYEPQFSEHSHGYRPGRGCHTALRDVAIGWTGTTWFIEGDISRCFDQLDFQVTLAALSEKIDDNRFLRLIGQMLQAGYLEDWVWNATLSGAPQGGVLSPCLSNIYLDRLDKFVEAVLLPEYTRGVHRSSNPEYKRISSAIRRARKRGDHAAARESWRQARLELEPFLKEQPDNYELIGDLALVMTGLRDKATAFALAEQAMRVVPLEKDVVDGPVPIEVFARAAAQLGEPDRAIAALQKLLSIPSEGALASRGPLTPALLRLDPMFDPLRNDQRFQKLTLEHVASR